MNAAEVPFTIGIVHLLQDALNPAHLGIEWSRQDKIGTWDQFCRLLRAMRRKQATGWMGLMAVKAEWI